MKFTLDLPFSKILFEDAQIKHKKYFSGLFFPVEKFKTLKKFKITIKFEKINIKGEKRYLEEDIVSSKESIFVLDTKNNKVELNIDSFGSKSIFLKVDPDFDLYFLYNSIIEPLLIIWAASHGILFIHSSAIYREPGSYIFPAWRHTGKTSSIFSLADQNIYFLGDDFSILYNFEVYLYPKYINIFSYNFESYPWLYKKLPFYISMRIKLSVYLKKLLLYFSNLFHGSLSKVFFRVSELAEISTNTKVSPKDLGLRVKTRGKLEKIIFITKGENNEKTQKLSKSAIEEKLFSITDYEISEFMSIYKKYKFLFPEKTNRVIESFRENFIKAVEANVKEASEKEIKPQVNKDAYLKDF